MNEILPGLTLEQQIIFDYFRASYIDAYRFNASPEQKLVAALSAAAAALAVREMVAAEIPDEEIFYHTPLLHHVSPDLPRSEIKLLSLSSLEPAGWREPADILKGMADSSLQVKLPRSNRGVA